MFTLTSGQPLTYTGAGDRYRKNKAAIQLLRALQAAGRSPDSLTDAEVRTLGHYTAFAETSLLTRALADTELGALLSSEDVAHIQRTALTAFYTAPEIYTVLWEALAPALRHWMDADQVERLTLLEPALGTGMAIATMPLDLRRRAAITGVELDRVSAQIAAYLHPDITLLGGQGLEECDLPDGTFDLVVSNVPFGGFAVFDPRIANDVLRRTIHDYFLARSLLLVRPGGLVAIITSYGTLDKRDPRVRAWVAARAELLTAVRLPQGVFNANAGTLCGADLLLFRRLPEGQPAGDPPAWIEASWLPVPIVADNETRFTTASQLSPGEFTDHGDGTGMLRVGQPFRAQPERILAQARIVHDRGHWFGHFQSGTTPVATLLRAQLATLSPQLLLPRPRRAEAEHTRAGRAGDGAGPRVQGLLAIHTAARRVLILDANGRDATVARAALHDAYDRFVASYGPIHSRANLRALKGEPELLFLKALETDVRPQSDGTIRVTKAPIFAAPTIRATPQVVPGSMTPDEALLTCLNTHGHVDSEAIADLCGRTPAEAVAALAGRIFPVPGSDRFETADAYLSGNVRSKLAEARAAAAHDPSFQNNVAALEAVQPAPLTPGQIRAQIGAVWMPPDVIETFIVENILPTFRGNSRIGHGRIFYNRALARWEISDGARARASHEATVVWGTRRRNAVELLLHALNGTVAEVFDSIDDGNGGEKRILNRQETLLAVEKVAQIKACFEQWIWADAERATRLCAIYNTLFNSTRRRDFDGAHLVLPGINTSILRGGDLAPHQKDAIWMGLQTRAMLLHLCVGAGKTFIGLAWAHEVRRLGLARKVCITVPNHLIGQWADEANRLYPALRVLAMTPDDFARERRGFFLSRMATEEWDVILLAHTSFGFIDPGEAATAFMRHEVAEYRSYLEELRARQTANSDDRTLKLAIKEIERKIIRFENRLKERAHAVAHDSARLLTWDELGIDALFVDEAAEFKNLGVPTAMGTIPGVPRSDSQRALDMRIKTWAMLQRGGRVIFATGTPVLNTLGEVFIMQKYLQDDTLKAYGIDHFDAWARTFARTEQIFEMTPDGGGFQLKTRLCRFVNLPELFQLWYMMTFSRSREQLGLPTPTMMTGRIIPAATPASPTLQRLVRSFVQRVDRIKQGRPLQIPSATGTTLIEDNMLRVVGDGAKAALDIRLVLPACPPDPVNKIATLAERVAAIYHRYDAVNATQLIYCELGTPKQEQSAPAPILEGETVDEDAVTAALTA